jgi:hypothetical protein
MVDLEQNMEGFDAGFRRIYSLHLVGNNGTIEDFCIR